MGFQVFRAERLQRQFQRHALLDEALQGAQQRHVRSVFAGLHGGDEIRGTCRHGLQAMAVFLGNGPEQGRGLLLEETRHQPLAACGRNLVEHRQRHAQGDPVLGRARLMQVAELELLAEHLECLRKAFGGDAFGLVPHELVARKVQQPGIRMLGLLPPLLEPGQIDDVLRNLGVVKGEDERFIHQHVGAARLVLEAFDLGDQAPILLEEGHAARRPLGDLSRHQAFADQQFATQGRIDVGIARRPSSVQHQPVQGATFPGTHRAGGLRPVRFGHLPPEQVSPDLLQPFGFDPRDTASEKPRGFHEFSTDQPFARLLRKRGARMRPEPDSARTEIAPRLGPGRILDPAADMAQQTREQGLVNRIEGRWELVLLPSVFGAQDMELAMHVAPFAHTHVRQEMLPAPGLLLAPRFVAHDLLPRVPQIAEPQELGALILLAAAESGVCLISRGAALLRTLARILDRKRSRDHQHLGEAAALACGEQHAADLGVERQSRQFASDRRQFARLVVAHRAEFCQQLVTVGDHARQRRIDEREVLDGTEAQRLHPQDDPGQRRSEDLGVGMLVASLEIVLVAEPDAYAIHDPPAAPRALFRRGTGDLLDLQLLDLVAVGIAFDPRQATVDHVADARHGERGLGDVRRQHDPPPLARREDSPLFLGRLARIQRQDLGPGRMMRLAQGLGHLADLALAGQEHEYAARTAALRLVDGIDDCIVEVAPLVLALCRAPARALPHRHIVFPGDRPVAHFNGIQSPGHLDHRRRPTVRAEMAGETLGVQRRRRHDDLEVRPPRKQGLEISEQKVDIEAALVRLVDDERVVGGQRSIGLRLRKQNAVGHQLDVGGRADTVGEADLVADRLSEFGLQLLRNTARGGARGQSPRLRMADQASHAASQLEADLGQLGGLP